MQLLNNPKDHSDPQRLQIYREVFERFINEFRTYEPILSEIKTVYDMTIHAQNLKILELEPFKAKTAILQYEASQEIERFRMEAAKKMDALDEKNRSLHLTNETLESEIANVRGHLKNLAEELRLKDLANSEQDVLKKQVHYLQAQMEMSEANFAEEISKKDAEISNLQMYLLRKTDECKAAIKETVSMKFSLAQRVPKGDLLDQVAQNEELRNKIKLLDDELKATKADLEKSNYNLGLKTSQLRKMESQGKGNFPDWEYVKYNCPGQIQDWVASCKGSDSNEAIVILLRQLLFLKSSKTQAQSVQVTVKEATPTISTQMIAEPTDDDKYFAGMGLGADVPKYLRYKGKVPNRMLSRKDIASLVNDIWTAKTVYDANPKNLKNLPEFLFLFLKKRFGSQDIVAEWGYNIYKAAIKYAGQSADCLLFSKVLEGTINEEVFHHLQETIELLKSVFYKCDMNLNKTCCGSLSKTECLKLLKQFWPEKSKQQLEALKHALDSDQAGETVSYSWLFNSDSESSFLDLVKEQENDLRESYIKGLQAAIQTVTRDPKCSSQEIMHGLMMYDHDKPKDDLERYMARGFGCEFEAIKPKSMVDLAVFFGNLKRGVLWFGKNKK
ncbi:UNVERIFIED_CONTAM: Translin-associated factor X-interacting protein 1 [Siphonaria sp. JEL0065]|nr:Translin-associated factor X-interacting protein 1 [Siphonaria sp. JEL0065]